MAVVAIGWGTAATSTYRFGTWQWAAVALLLAVTAAGWLLWVLGPGGSRPAAVAGVGAIGVAGLLLSFLVPHSPAVALLAVSVARAANLWGPRPTIRYGLVLTAAYLAGHALIGETWAWQLVGVGSVAAGLLIGLVRWQSDQLAAEARHARDEQARSAALDERARIAREIHDVLAHALAALSVQLETADALLESGRDEQARGAVQRAGQLAREGLAETRRAIGALRGETLPLPQLLATLASGYQDDLAAPARVEIVGEPRELRPDVSLTLYRTAQEAITNVRKHAPGAPVDVALAYRPAEVALAVTNGGGNGTGTPLAGTGGGYGLAGLRERAELAGGTMAAAPEGAGWRVDVRIPA
jgi:signal transduction histidine kinase